MQLRLSLSGEKPSKGSADLWRKFEGVGMIRGEFLLRSTGEYLTIPSARDLIASYVEDIATVFAPRPVWYRTTDFWTNEANPLNGIDHIWEEENPIVGRRGLRRGLLAPEMLEAEVRTVAAVAKRHKNLNLLLPYVGDADEFSQANEILARADWPNRIGCMLEIPSAILEVERFVAAGATNLMLGLNDLTCLLTGAARKSGVASKTHRSVWWCVDYLAARLSSTFEWGIAGSLTKDILEQAEEHRVPYASLHYSELPDLLNVEKSELHDIDVVRQIKKITRSRAAEFAKRRALNSST